MHTRERHELYVNRWLAVDEDDHQIVRELAVQRAPAADKLPGRSHHRSLDSSFPFT